MSDIEEPLNDTETKIIEKLKKTLKVKPQKSERQLAHIEKLAKAKRGSKYKKVIEPVEVKEEPVEVKEEPIEVIKKKKKKVVYVESSSESEEEEIVYKKKKKIQKPVIKPKAKPKAKAKVKEPITEVVKEFKRQSYFNLDIC